MSEDNNIDWANFYQQVQEQAKIPAISATVYERSQVVIRDLLVNLNDVYAQIRQRGLEPAVVSIYADVVTISNNFAPAIDGTGLLIAARRIEAESKTNIILDYRSSQVGKLVIYAREIFGELQAKVVTVVENSPQVTLFNISHLEDVEAIGSVVSCKNNTPQIATVQSVDDSSLQLGTPMRLSLASIFQVATVVFYSHPDVARSMLSWIVSTTRGSKVALDVYLQSSALLAQLNLSGSAITWIPYLDKDVYTTVANSFLGAAKAYEQQYQRFSDLTLDITARKEAAALMLKHYQDTTNYNQQLIDQSTANFKAAQKALIQTEVSLKIQQSQTEIARIEFKYDAKIWTREQIIKAVLGITSSLVQFVGSIALMAVGDEAAGAQAGAAVATGVEAAQAAAQAAEEAEEVSQFANTMKELADSMKKLKDVGEALQKTYEAISKIVEASNSIAEATEVVGVTVPSADDISAQEEWDVFKVEAEALLKPAIDAKVPGALEYQVELDKLAIYGKAFMASQVAVIKTGQELARLQMQKQVSTNQETCLTQYVDQLSDTTIANDEMIQQFFERELNIKRWLFIAAQNYTWAYHYWALNSSRVQLSIIKPVSEFEEDLATIQQEYAEALESFNPPPQPFQGIAVVIEDVDEGQYKNVISNLKQNCATTFSINLDEPAFNGFGRIRLTTVRVWLEGVEVSPSKPLQIDITTSGIYSDRLLGKTYRFASNPLQRVFKYNDLPSNPNSILVDGKIDDREKYLYFQPTPLTQWSIKVLKEENAGIDLSTLRSLKIEFSGSIVDATDNF